MSYRKARTQHDELSLLLYPDYDVGCRNAECCSRAVGYVEGTGTGRVGTLKN